MRFKMHLNAHLKLHLRILTPISEEILILIFKEEFKKSIKI